MSEWEIPNMIRCLRLKDIQELLENPSLKHGLWEESPIASGLSDRIRDEVNVQRKTTENIVLLLESIELQQKKHNELVRDESLAAAKWSLVEAEMLRKTEPYTGVGIAKSIEKNLQELISVSKSCEMKLLNSDSGFEDPVIVAKRFVQAKQQILYYQKLLESLWGYAS